MGSPAFDSCERRIPAAEDVAVSDAGYSMIRYFAWVGIEGEISPEDAVAQLGRAGIVVQASRGVTVATFWANVQFVKVGLLKPPDVVYIAPPYCAVLPTNRQFVVKTVRV
jgi:hypothetical protein